MLIGNNVGMYLWFTYEVHTLGEDKGMIYV